MIAQKLYLTKEATSNSYHYITDPINPFSIQPMGIIEVDKSEIRVDEFGAYVTRFIEENKNTGNGINLAKGTN